MGTAARNSSGQCTGFDIARDAVTGTRNNAGMRREQGIGGGFKRPEPSLFLIDGRVDIGDRTRAGVGSPGPTAPRGHLDNAAVSMRAVTSTIGITRS